MKLVAFLLFALVFAVLISPLRAQAPDQPPAAGQPAPAPAITPAPAPTPAAEPDSAIGKLGKMLSDSLSGSPTVAAGAPSGPNPLAMILPEPLKGLVEKYNIRPAFNADFVFNAWDAREFQSIDLKRLLVRELELGLTAEFTPTIRGDLIITAGRDKNSRTLNFGIEEGYVTFLDLPLGFQARLGKFKSAFGKANQLHTHARPWIDVPLPIKNFFGEEGLVGPGVSLTHLVPNPWDIYSEIAFQVFHPTRTDEFFGQRSGNSAELVHWKNVFDLNPSTTLDLGLTAANVEFQKGGHAIAEGLDATVKWKPLDEGLYRSVTWQTEIYHMHRDSGFEGRNGLWGAYTSVENQFSRRWFGGLRLDYSQVAAGGSSEFDIVPFVTFRQTERIFYRLQYNHTFNDPERDGKRGNEIRLQFNISLGTHPPHAY